MTAMKADDNGPYICPYCHARVPVGSIATHLAPHEKGKGRK